MTMEHKLIKKYRNLNKMDDFIDNFYRELFEEKENV